jgi:uncharacterized protein involved in exopolysaccharide biosynthesis/Mrp family chromosome partitioning ATPase
VLLTAEGYTPRGSTGPESPLAPLLRHLLAWKWTILGASLAGAVLTGFVLAMMTPRYVGEAVMVVESRRNRIADAESALTGLLLDQPAVRSEVDLLRSPEIARHVILEHNLMETLDYAARLDSVPAADRFAELRLVIQGAAAGVRHRLFGADAEEDVPPATAEAPELRERRLQRAVALFERNLSVVHDPKSFTIRVMYRSSSPRLAAAVPNAVLDRYYELGVQNRREVVERNREWIDGRLVEVRAAVQSAERALEEHRARHSLANNRERDPLQEELLVLHTRLAEARVDSVRAAAAVEQLERTGRDAPGRATLPEVLASDVVGQLRTQEAMQQMRLSEMQATLGRNHPQTAQARATVADIQARIAAEIGRIGSGLQVQLAAAQGRETAIRASIRELRQRIDQANAADVMLRALEQDAGVARTVLDNFVRRYNESLGQPLAAPDSRVIAQATPPAVPASPRYGLLLMLGTTVSGGLALAWSVIISGLRAGFTTQREMAEELGIPVAGAMPLVRGMGRRFRSGLGARDAAALRDTAVAVRAAAPRLGSMPARGKVLVVASALPGEGKSTLALSIARSAAKGGQSCLLVDGDLRRASLFRMLAVEEGPGLPEAVQAGRTDDLVLPVAGERFLFLGAGRPVEDPLQPFETERFAELLDSLKQRFDVIVFDAPAVLAAPEALLLSGHADVTLFLAKWRSTPKDLARKAVDLLRTRSAHCLGVLSQVDVRRLDRREADRVEETYRAYYRRP